MVLCYCSCLQYLQLHWKKNEQIFTHIQKSLQVNMVHCSQRIILWCCAFVVFPVYFHALILHCFWSLMIFFYSILPVRPIPFSSVSKILGKLVNDWFFGHAWQFGCPYGTATYSMEPMYSVASLICTVFWMSTACDIFVHAVTVGRCACRGFLFI